MVPLLVLLRTDVVLAAECVPGSDTAEVGVLVVTIRIVSPGLGRAGHFPPKLLHEKGLCHGLSVYIRDIP